MRATPSQHSIMHGHQELLNPVVRRNLPDITMYVNFFFADEAQAPSYTGSDVPDQDVVVVDDDRDVRPPSPSAPPADMFDSYAGYENVGFGK